MAKGSKVTNKALPLERLHLCGITREVKLARLIANKKRKHGINLVRQVRGLRSPGGRQMWQRIPGIPRNPEKLMEWSLPRLPQIWPAEAGRVWRKCRARRSLAGLEKPAEGTEDAEAGRVASNGSTEPRKVAARTAASANSAGEASRNGWRFLPGAGGLF